MSERGKYIVIEGTDGTGKSSQVDMLQHSLLERGVQAIQIHEPDGFAGDNTLGLPRVDEAIALRQRIKDGTIDRTPWQNVEWNTAARKANWERVMRPALQRGIWVVAARNYVSTLAYQGFGEGVSLDDILTYTAEQVGEEYMRPDFQTVLVLGSEATRQARIQNRGVLDRPDTFESRGAEFQAAVSSAYSQIANQQHIATIDAGGTKQEVQNLIIADLRQQVPDSPV
ncbi:dTMP kinase [Candidatus Mycosynbacter amalyticus]|uniref:Thymidylate kinase n=1 Tax=Candidatus Mycosynbacter amalyticus TaxID=2665156 RepID=A0A857MMG3_9BACT|nr:dTMP kinase [Candidatus Mycosynbacter amalyticus]QHN42772.1 dTMP kinase [Candidatus Mycosynbacter amalyticus]